MRFLVVVGKVSLGVSGSFGGVFSIGFGEFGVGSF